MLSHPVVQPWLPQRAINRLAGWLANTTIPWLKNYLIRYFLKRHAVNLDEACLTDPMQYPSFNAFFTRALKSECRPLSPDPQDLSSPVDGCISQMGSIQDARLIQAKGHSFTVDDLLGATHNPELQNKTRVFNNGSFITLYLAPHDYHRVHMPITGTLSQMIYIPGRLFSVDARTAQRIPNLFAANERVACLFDTAQGPMALILVGAMIVGSIETVWAGAVSGPQTACNSTQPKNAKKPEIQHWTYPTPITLERGAEMGRFQLGSTVIVLLPQDAPLCWDPQHAAGHSIRMGERLGSLTKQNLFFNHS